MKNINSNLIKTNSFTFIRTVFCLIVIFDHTWQISDVNHSLITGLSGNASVPIFFILSGFWVTMSCLRSVSTKEYALKRFKKIFPSYWLVVGSCTVIFVFFSNVSIREYFCSIQFIKYLLANFSTLNFLCINLPGTFFKHGIDAALWTVKVEVGFYIVLPFIIFVTDKICYCLEVHGNHDTIYTTDGEYEPRVNSITCVVLYILSIICALVLPILIKRFHLPQSLDHQLPSLFYYFAAGMLCFFNLELLLRYGKFFIIPCLVICVCNLTFRWKILFPFFPMSLAISVIYIGFKIPVFSKMKDFSYGMYLVHCPIINVLTFTNIFQVHPIMGLLFVVGMSFACAYILEKVISIKALTFKIQKESIL